MSQDFSGIADKTIGIYAVKNTTTGEHYVGQSRDIRKKFNDHGHKLRSGNHHNDRIQSSWSVYGEDSFEFIILENIESMESLNVREQHWMDLLNAYSTDNGFNLCINTYSPINHYLDPESKSRTQRSLRLKKPKSKYRRVHDS